MTEDGQSGVTTIARAAGADLDEAEVSVQANGGPPRVIGAKGWAKPLELYRPFLSYSELGALVSGQPSKMHDALQAILGLDLLVAAGMRPDHTAGARAEPGPVLGRRAARWRERRGEV